MSIVGFIAISLVSCKPTFFSPYFTNGDADILVCPTCAGQSGQQRILYLLISSTGTIDVELTIQKIEDLSIRRCLQFRVWER